MTLYIDYDCDTRTIWRDDYLHIPLPLVSWIYWGKPSFHAGFYLWGLQVLCFAFNDVLSHWSHPHTVHSQVKIWTGANLYLCLYHFITTTHTDGGPQRIFNSCLIWRRQIFLTPSHFLLLHGSIPRTPHLWDTHTPTRIRTLYIFRLMYRYTVPLYTTYMDELYFCVHCCTTWHYLHIHTLVVHTLW